jgi:hypothetical protein
MTDQNHYTSFFDEKMDNDSSIPITPQSSDNKKFKTSSSVTNDDSEKSFDDDSISPGTKLQFSDHSSFNNGNIFFFPL